MNSNDVKRKARKHCQNISKNPTIEKGKVDTSNTLIHDGLLSWLDTRHFSKKWQN
jgi:hypothetical protein